jgi:Tol biopolymer transport system component
MRTVAVLALFLVAVAAPRAVQIPRAPSPAPPPGTDIYLIPLSGGLPSLKAAKPLAVSTAPGYDNQPHFSPDGNRILFAANRDGRQTDVYVFDRAAGRVSQLTQTPESENSPTFVPGGAGPAGSFSVVRSEFDGTGARPPSPIQRLWRFNADGKSPSLILADITPVGYHAWIDADRLVLFVLGSGGKPSTLQIASVKTGRAEVAAEGIGRSLHRIPGTTLASFVHRQGEESWIKQIDVASKQIDPLVKVVEGNTERDMTWMPDGKTILMSGGTKIYSWTTGAAGWTEEFDGAPHQLGAVTRLAVSPTGDALAIVVAEPKE